MEEEDLEKGDQGSQNNTSLDGSTTQEVIVTAEDIAKYLSDELRKNSKVNVSSDDTLMIPQQSSSSLEEEEAFLQQEAELLQNDEFIIDEELMND